MRQGLLLWFALVCPVCRGQGWQPDPLEPIGPSSLRSGVVISEIMHSAAPRLDGRDIEFLELHNTEAFPIDLTRYRVSGEVEFFFAPGTVLAGGAYGVLAKDSADLRATYGALPILGEYNGTLGGNGTLRLRNERDEIVFEVEYSSQSPWPLAATGAGHSLVLAHPSFGENNPRAWGASDKMGGSPGRVDPLPTDPLRAVVINEFLAYPAPPFLDYIELFNRGDRPLDLAGCILTDHPNLDRFVFGPGSVIPPGGFLALDEFIFRFGLGIDSDEIYLISPRNAAGGVRVLDGVRYDAQEKGVSVGRYPNGSPGFIPLQQLSPFAPNSPRRAGVIINEIAYDPPSGGSMDEFIELHNAGTNRVDIGGWRLSGGISFVIPENRSLGPGDFLVIANDAAHLREVYPHLNALNVVGNYGGNLANEGELIALHRLEQILGTNTLGEQTIQNRYLYVDEVHYRSGGEWGQWSHGGGSSLELVDPQARHNEPGNWADSVEAGQWAFYEATEALESEAASFQLALLGEGECQLDGVEVVAAGVAGNLVLNPGFSVGTSNWVIIGNHVRSGLAAGASPTQSAPCLQVRASGRGDAGPNSISAPLLHPVAAGQQVNIRCWMRWLRGCPDVTVRLQGGGLERVFTLPIPRQFGTPGLPNSRAKPNLGPLIAEVSTRPIFPAPGQPVLVQAQVQDPDGIASVFLRHRVDPGTTWQSVAMRDDGQGGDVAARDGFYTAALPAAAAGEVIAYIIEATDQHPAPQTGRYPAAPGQCLVGFGQGRSPGALPVYNIWMTAAVREALTTGPVLGHEPMPVTFAYNDRVIHNVGCWVASDPLDQQVSVDDGSASLSLLFSRDQPFLGLMGPTRVQSLAGDKSLQREQAAQWIARQLGLVEAPRRYVSVLINGAPYGVLAEHRWTPVADPPGALTWQYRLEPWYEFGALDGSNRAHVPIRVVGAQSGLPRPLWMFHSLGERFTSAGYIGALNSFQAALSNDSQDFYEQLANRIDAKGWALLFAWEHAIGNWRSFGHAMGERAYLGEVAGRWRLRPSDAGPCFGQTGSFGPAGDDLLWHDAMDAGLSALYQEPLFQRLYWSQLREVMNKGLGDPALFSRLDLRQNWLLTNGIAADAGALSAFKSWIQTRVGYLGESLEPLLRPAIVFGPQQVAVSNITVTLEGYAPIHLSGLLVNGALVKPIWSSVTNWSISLGLPSRTNRFEVSAQYDGGLAGQIGEITYVVSEDAPRPQGWVIINEISHGSADNSDYVELYNRHATAPFDLSGWFLEGMQYTFEEGTILGPGEFLVVPGSLAAFRERFGTGPPSTSSGAGNGLGEVGILRLIRVFPAPLSSEVIDQVRFESAPPWPSVGSPSRASLQLIDASLDRSRVGNWAVANAPEQDAYTPGRSNSVARSLPAYEPVWLNEWTRLQGFSAASPRDHLGQRDPWLELHNSGSNWIDLKDYSLETDGQGGTWSWPFPSGAKLGPGQFTIVWLDGQPEQTTQGEWHTSFPADGLSFIALVRRFEGGKQITDYLRARESPGYMTFGKLIGGDPTVLQDLVPSPGSSNSKQHFINEWMARNSTTLLDPADQDSDDWIELFNPIDWPIDLSSFLLGDTRSRITLPPGTIIPPGGYVLVWADGESGQNAPGRETHADFRLGGDGDAIYLSAPDTLRILDSVSFGPQQTDVSMGRWPDGATNLFFMPNSSPRGPNRILSAPNSPPQMSPIADVQARPGELLSLAPNGADGDVPEQGLIFSLSLNAPVGASIDRATGLLQWPIPADQSPGVYLMSVRLTDTGQPPLSIVQSFKVNLIGPVALQISLSESQMELSAPSILGATYVLEGTENLNGTAWMTVYGPFMADSDAISIAFQIDPYTQRFFRLVQVDSP